MSSHSLPRQACFGVLIVFLVVTSKAFDRPTYSQFLNDNNGLTSSQLLTRAQPVSPYYSSIVQGTSGMQCVFLDSITKKYSLTDDELNLLKKNGFVITERMNSSIGYSFGRTLHDIYRKDLPVFVTTDAVLYALHKSYDTILMEVEEYTLFPKLKSLLTALYEAMPALISSYQGNALMQTALSDVDCYVSMALSLVDSAKKTPHLVGVSKIDSLWNLIANAQMVKLPLFSVTARAIDFSQFTVRGHYTRSPQLTKYFRAMMWLARTDFALTIPKGERDSWDPSDPRRMSIGACLLGELMDAAAVRTQLAEIDKFLTLLVGKSDNLTPEELKSISGRCGVTHASALLADSTFATFQKALMQDTGSGQKILSDIIVADPYSSTPDTLPVSFRLLGQRFIVDSYILANVVYDRIIFNGAKIFRMMPSPLDAMYVLGNNDALPLLKTELDDYPYAPQLTALRYLVDGYESAFWQQSLYNSWLQAIRLLKPIDNQTGLPLFMKTTAWHQEKLNTQLASWSELRHDNLLYAKQSYTSATECSFPHSYIEPYPEVFRQIAAFAQKANETFKDVSSFNRVYFSKLATIMNRLDTLSQKELSQTAFSDSDKVFLQRMLFEQAGSGAPPFSGWYADLFYDNQKVEEKDYTIADVHTQPTDVGGAVVGKVLHVGTGKINLGVFIAPSPSNGFTPMAYVGPVFSYYEKITNDFLRLTDEKWTAFIDSNSIPARPDWVNSFLADGSGAALPAGRNLSGVEYSVGIKSNLKTTKTMPQLLQINNASRQMSVSYVIQHSSSVRLSVYNQLGKAICQQSVLNQGPGKYTMPLQAKSFAPGMYLMELIAGNERISKKIIMP
jgi:hypothetical protein